MPKCTRHHENHSARESLCKFVSIDSWDEILDSPIEVGVIRARGNWQARLAAAALAIQRGHETRIIPDQVCWPCYLDLKQLPRRPALAGDDGTDREDETFAAFPQYLQEGEDSESETEEMVQNAMRRDEKKSCLDKDEDDSDGSVDRYNRNVVYVL